MNAFITAGTVIVSGSPRIGRDLQSFADRQMDTATPAARHFPQPVAEVINWDRDPQRQSLLLEP